MNTTKKRANAVVTVTDMPEGMTFNVLGAGSITLNYADISANNQRRAMLHGLKQRVSDAAALPCDETTGKPASPADKFESLSAIVEHLNSGSDDWSLKRSGEGVVRVGQTLIAIMRVYKLADEAAARVYVENTAGKRGIEYKAALALWKSSDKITAELAKMAAETPAKVNADDLLSEM